MARARETLRLNEGRVREGSDLVLPAAAMNNQGEAQSAPSLGEASPVVVDPVAPVAGELDEPIEGAAPALSTAPEGPWRSYKEKIAILADRILDAQKPIRILNALKWEPPVWEGFRKSRFRELPKVDAESYQKVELGFDPASRARDFQGLADDVRLWLGADDAIARILRETCLEYRDVCHMLGVRGTTEFYAHSRRLYGSPKDTFPDGRTSVRDIARTLYTLLTNLDEATLGAAPARDLDGAQVVEILRERFRSYFGEAAINVMLDDGIIADAAAGSDYVKIRGSARFSAADVDILEVHEGWVHVATSLNGAQQHVARWLGKGPPRTTSVQEGLAALMEVLTFRSHPRRARRLNERVLAVDKAEDGADFLDVFEWYRTEGYDEEDCFNAARRVFRGGIVQGGGPFTKDIAYTRGLVTNYHFIRSAIRACRPELVRFLFVGKVAHEDVPVLYARVSDGVVRPPKYLPPLFSDLNALSIWMAYSGFFSQMGLQEMFDYYAQLFQNG